MQYLCTSQCESREGGDGHTMGSDNPCMTTLTCYLMSKGVEKTFVVPNISQRSFLSRHTLYNVLSIISYIYDAKLILACYFG